MNYLLNLELPLYWLFLPLVIAGLCAYKYYQVRYILQKQKSRHEKDVETAIQNYKIEELLKQRNELVSALKLAQERADLSAKKCYKLETDAAEREALIEQLNKQVTEQSERLAKHDELAKKHGANMAGKVKEIEQLKAEVTYLDERNEKLYNLVTANSRTRKAWEKINKCQNIAVQNLQQQPEVVHDSLGVPTITQADQSEGFNARHIKELGSEVVRGIEQQNAAIKKELEQVDMSMLEAGDRVRFRNDIFQAIEKIDFLKSEGEGDNHTIKIRFSDSPFNHYYDKFGNYEINTLDNMDIIQIIKQPKNN